MLTKPVVRICLRTGLTEAGKESPSVLKVILCVVPTDVLLY